MSGPVADGPNPTSESLVSAGSSASPPAVCKEASPAPLEPVTEEEPGSRETETAPFPDKASRSRPSTTGERPRSRSRDDTSPPKTASSGEGRSSRSRKKNVSPPLGSHRVTFTVTIAQAIPTVYHGAYSGDTVDDSSPYSLRTVNEDDTPDGQGGGKKKKRIVEAPRPQNYFHMEYLLLPVDDEPVKTDVVTFGIAAKIYTERQEPKVLKTWEDGDVTWVAWTHCHTVSVTEELLKELCNHTVELRVWNTKDKVSTRARFDRPRAFRFPPPKPGEDSDGVGGVKTLVMKQSENFELRQPKRSYINRPLPPLGDRRDSAAESRESPERAKKVSPGGKKARIKDTSPKGVKGRKGHKAAGGRKSNQLKATPGPAGTSPERTDQHKPKSASLEKPGQPDSILLHVGSSDPSPLKSYSRLGKLAGVESPTEPKEPKTRRSRSRKQNSELKNDLQSSQGRSAEPNEESEAGEIRESSKSRRGKKVDAATAAAAEYAKKYGVCRVPLKMAGLIAGAETVTERLEKTVTGIEDIFVTVSLSGPLLSEDQKEKLNPLVVRVHSATNMPDTPLSYEQLRTKCQPAYVKYNLYKQPSHCSIGREQDGSIFWDDVHVLLAGTIDASELREYLNGPLLEIELHDRDRILEKQKLKPTLFGDDLEDEKISNVGTVASKRTLHNPFSGRDKPWDPFGVARFDLSGLLLGQQTIHLSAPVHCCPMPDVLGLRDGKQDGKLLGVSGAVDGPEDAPLAPGHYLQSNALMKIKVEVAHPIVTPSQVATKEDFASSQECPFSRIVYRFAYNNVTFLQNLQALVTSINAEALEMTDMPAHVIETALSTYKLSVDQQQSRVLDIVTGFQLLDGTMHLFVLEGLGDKAIDQLWQSLPKPHNSDVEILYNSDLRFRDRLYGPLDVDLTRIKLHEPLSLIVQQPLLYVRDMVPKPCFEALVKLEQLRSMSRLQDAVRNGLFPTAQMVISMSREFGVPLTAEDFEELQPEPINFGVEPIQTYELPQTSRLWTPIDNRNIRYEDSMQEREKTSLAKNYHKENLEKVSRQSAQNRLQRSKTMPATIRVEGPAAHNYSTQMLNSTEQAKERLRNVLAQEPDRRFTYCPDYHHSMTVVPVNVEALKKEELKSSKDAWKTSAGWIYPGKKTMIESNKHAQRPDVARADELLRPWTENSLHAKYRPTLERDRYKWSGRHHDMDLWTRPHPVFGKEEPITIHLAGRKLQAEKLAALEEDSEKWRSKIKTDDTRMWFHRCATETELQEEGFKSSNQLARLHGLLKDSPSKYSLRQPGYALRDIPPLNVVLNPSVDTLAREAGLPVVPAMHSGEQERSKGFLPGPYAELSWTLEKNQIPVRDYEHQKFKDARGQDFNVYHKERSGLFKRQINPLTDDEYDTHLFRWPSDLIRTSYVIPDVDEFKRRHLTQGTIDSGIATLSRDATNFTEPGAVEAT